jgi:nucleotide-binding universal stress UspA family protein
MYRHILVPTDGSRLSTKAVKAAVELARQTGARITGVHVIPPFTPPAYADAMVYVPPMDPRDYKRVTENEAKKALAAVEAECRRARVPYAGVALTNRQAWDGILRTARAKKCDTIVMASHGRRGLTGLVLGSETHKVLTHSKIPVLVCR